MIVEPLALRFLGNLKDRGDAPGGRPLRWLWLSFLLRFVGLFLLEFTEHLYLPVLSPRDHYIIAKDCDTMSLLVG